jgi:ataxin-10
MLFEFILAYSDDANTIDEINFTTNCNTFLSFWSSHSNLLFLQENFKELTKTLLSKENFLLSLYSALPSHNPESEELIKAFLAMLSLLCQLSCYVNMLELLQKDAALFQCSMDILSVLSDIDGSSTSGKHRSYLSSSGGTYDDKTAAAHPLFGVKRDIVRLIGNLCYRCSQNQDLVHDFMPLLLNQCSIDHSNPFIMQWALWAIRNVCENNPANQLLIRQIEHKGVHDIDEIQRNLGCEVEIASNGKLRIKK